MKTINNQFYIETIYDNFIFKLVRFFLKKLTHKNFKYLNEKINNIDILKKKFLIKNKNYFFKYIFSESNYPNFWYETAKNKKDKSLIIHYPHSPYIFFLKKKFKKTYNLHGDILLINGKEV